MVKAEQNGLASNQLNDSVLVVRLTLLIILVLLTSAFAQPTVTGTEPSAIVAVESRQWITVLGTGFSPDSVVIFELDEETFEIPPDRKDYVDSTSIRVYAGLFPASDSWRVRVKDSQGGSSEPFALVFAESHQAAGHESPPNTQAPGSTVSVAPSVSSGRTPFIPGTSQANYWSNTSEEIGFLELANGFLNLFYSYGLRHIDGLSHASCSTFMKGDMSRETVVAFTSYDGQTSVISVCHTIDVYPEVQRLLNERSSRRMLAMYMPEIRQISTILEFALRAIRDSVLDGSLAYSAWSYDDDDLIFTIDAMIQTYRYPLPAALRIYYGIDFLVLMFLF